MTWQVESLIFIPKLQWSKPARSTPPPTGLSNRATELCMPNIEIPNHKQQISNKSPQRGSFGAISNPKSPKPISRPVWDFDHSVIVVCLFFEFCYL